MWKQHYNSNLWIEDGISMINNTQYDVNYRAS